MNQFFSVVALCALILALGCAKKESVDTVKFEASFSTAEPSTKTEADKIIAAVKAQDWAGATASLKSLASNAKLTGEQKTAINDTLARIGNSFKETADKAVKETGKAFDNAKESLQK